MKETREENRKRKQKRDGKGREARITDNSNCLCVLQVFRVRSLGWMEVCEADMASGSIVISDCIRLLCHSNTQTLRRRERESAGEMEEVKMMNRVLDLDFQ